MLPALPPPIGNGAVVGILIAMHLVMTLGGLAICSCLRDIRDELRTIRKRGFGVTTSTIHIDGKPRAVEVER